MSAKKFVSMGNVIEYDASFQCPSFNRSGMFIGMVPMNPATGSVGTMDAADDSEQTKRLGAILDKLQTLGSDTLAIKGLLAGGVSPAIVIEQLVTKLGIAKSADAISALEGWVTAAMRARSEASPTDTATTDAAAMDAAWDRRNARRGIAVAGTDAYGRVVHPTMPRDDNSSVARYLRGETTDTSTMDSVSAYLAD